MADKKISALTGATTPLAGTEVLPIVQGSATVKVSVADLTAGRAVAMAGGSFTDNFTQGTAAKGVNFTANTPAAGMTSQLLNNYEEGTFTPTIVSGGFSSLSSARANYTRIGRCVYIVLDAQLVGTGNGTVLKIGGLPFTVSTNGWAGTSFFADKINTANYNLSGVFASTTTEIWTVINVAGTNRNGIGTDYSAGGVNFAGFYFV